MCKAWLTHKILAVKDERSDLRLKVGAPNDALVSKKSLLDAGIDPLEIVVGSVLEGRYMFVPSLDVDEDAWRLIVPACGADGSPYARIV